MHVAYNFDREIVWVKLVEGVQQITRNGPHLQQSRVVDYDFIVGKHEQVRLLKRSPLKMVDLLCQEVDDLNRFSSVSKREEEVRELRLLDIYEVLLHFDAYHLSVIESVKLEMVHERSCLDVFFYRNNHSFYVAHLLCYWSSEFTKNNLPDKQQMAFATPHFPVASCILIGHGLSVTNSEFT